MAAHFEACSNCSYFTDQLEHEDFRMKMHLNVENKMKIESDQFLVFFLLFHC